MSKAPHAIAPIKTREAGSELAKTRLVPAMLSNPPMTLFKYSAFSNFKQRNLDKKVRIIELFIPSMHAILFRLRVVYCYCHLLKKTAAIYRAKMKLRIIINLVALLAVLSRSVTAQIVLNEIHYDPVNKTSFEEFIELYNMGDTAVDLSEWSLRDAVEYTFPPGTTIASHGYIVVAQDPSVVYSIYGAAALGPWDGRLSNEGEDIELYDDTNSRRDRVEYKLGFPWPTAGDALGTSIELINPSFDNDLGGNWRSSIGPTPGAINSAFATNAPPQIRQVNHSPNQPVEGEPVIVTAKISDPEGVDSVSLYYQIVDPGAYIALDDSAYASNWITIPMTDDGTGGDEMAGDSIYTATLSEAIQQHRRLVRYRISSTDDVAATITVPYLDDPQPNFAYFCYNGVPAWQGAVNTNSTPVIEFGTNIMRRLPAVHLISKNTDVETATWFERYMGDLYKWSGTIVYDGEVYDHIHYRARGGVHRYDMVKNMWKFDFNRGHDFQMRDDYGKKYDTKWTKLNLGACIQQSIFGAHRGEQGMFESVGSRLFNLAGVPSFKTSFTQFRIIDDVDETETDQYEGDFWGLYLVIEQLDGNFLEEHGLPDGNLYKMDEDEYVYGDLNNLGYLGPSDKSDLYYILENYGGYDYGDTHYPYPAASDAWWEANWNLKDYYSYQTIIQAIHHYDIWNGKNYFYYRNPESGIWSVFPWDLDETWADNMYNPSWGGMNPLADRILDADAFFKSLSLYGSTNRALFRVAFRNRIREIRDLLFNPDQTGQLIDEKASLLRDVGVSPSFLDADRAMWDYNPKMDDWTYSSWVDNASTGQFYQWPYEPGVSDDFEGCIQLMKNYITARGSKLDILADDSDIPDTPTITYAGAAGYPLNGLTFQCSTFIDPQGAGSFAAMKWRAGEILDVSAPTFDPTEEPPYEIETKWESNSISNFSNSITIPPDALKVGHAYRVRVRMQDNTGRWSHWSNPVEFIATEPSTAGTMVSQLRISELMYDPPAGSDFEYIELHNLSSDDSLDLSGAAFTTGIDFNFPNGTTIAANGYLLLIGTTNESAFRAHYQLATNVVITGAYEGNLSNSGEELRIKTAPGGTDIASFEYGNSRHWPLAAAGAGHSLVPLSTTGQATGSLDYPGNWRASTYIGGSPGSADPEPPQAIFVLSEITAHTDYYNPARPDYDSNDWIELFNATASPINLSGWYLSDDPAEPGKWACPAASIPAGGYAVFNETDDFHNPITIGFGLDKAGEQVLLSYLPGTSSNRVADAIGFKGQENNRSLSRIDNYWYATELSQGVANSSPLDGLRITEIMYCPAAMGTNDNTRDEFIEIYNPTASNITMQTVDEAWRIDGGVEYTFPDNTEIPAGSILLVVGFDPSDNATSNAFATTYGLTNGVHMFGPWSANLGNRSERVALERPQVPDFVGDDYSWVVVDETVYGNQHPWPSSAAGGGNALFRLLFNHSGIDPENWWAAAPTPGTPSPSPYADQDGDGMSDYDEWICGTDAGDPDSYFRIGISDMMNCTWTSVSGRCYTVYWTDDLRVPFMPIATSLFYPMSNFIDTAHSTRPENFYRLGVELRPSPSPFADQDGDGMSDYDEWICGTNPGNPDSYFTIGITNMTNYTWTPVPGRSYSVYWTDDLRAPFVPIATGLFYPQSNFTDSVHSTNSQNFYQMEVELQ